MPVIGFLQQHVARCFDPLVTAFRQGLKEAGFVDGQNVAIEFRYADNQFDRLPALVAELIRRPVAVIVVNTPWRTRPRPQPGRSRSSSRRGATRSVRPRRQPQPAGRQPHGRKLLYL